MQETNEFRTRLARRRSRTSLVSRPSWRAPRGLGVQSPCHPQPCGERAQLLFTSRTHVGRGYSRTELIPDNLKSAGVRALETLAGGFAIGHLETAQTMNREAEKCTNAGIGARYIRQERVVLFTHLVTTTLNEDVLFHVFQVVDIQLQILAREEA